MKHGKPQQKVSWQVQVIVWGLLALLAVFIWQGVQNATNEEELRKEQERQAQVEELNQVVANRQPTIDTYAPLYCQSHQNVVTTFEDESYPSNDGSGWTQDECVKIIGILYDNDSTAEDIGNIVNAKVWIGMTHVELWYLVGNPDDINTSNYGGGNISRQLVYGSNYVYLDASNTVTSYQMY